MGNKNSSNNDCKHGRAADRSGDMNSLTSQINPRLSRLETYKNDSVKIVGDFDKVYKSLSDMEKKIIDRTKENNTEFSNITSQKKRLEKTLANRSVELNLLINDLESRKLSNDKKNKLLRDYKNSIAETSNKNNELNKAVVVSTQQYHNALKSENRILDNNSKQTVDNYSTDNSRNFYLFETKDILTTMNDYFSMIYYILLIIFAYFIFYKPIPWYSKTILIIILILFPFFITQLQDNLRFVYKYVKIDLLKI
jgi:hypothetical protein